MRKLNKIIALCLLCCFMINPASPARAGGGGLAGGATEMTQLMNNAELLKQVSQLAEQIQNQITMIQDMTHNTMTMPNQLFRDVRGVYSSIKGIIDRTRGIAFNLANLDEELRRRFRSYDDMRSLSRASGFSSEYRSIMETQMETVRNTMEAIGVSFEELIRDDTSALAELQRKASSASGRNELIQATNQLLGFLAEDAMRLRQLQMMQAQMVGTAYEAERAIADLSDRRIDAFFRRGNENPVDIPSESIIERFAR